MVSYYIKWVKHITHLILYLKLCIFLGGMEISTPSEHLMEGGGETELFFALLVKTCNHRVALYISIIYT